MNSFSRGVLFALCSLVIPGGAALAQSVPVIPAPMKAEASTGAFRIGKSVVIRHDKSSKSEAQLLAGLLKTRLGVTPKTTGGNGSLAANSITLKIDPNLPLKDGGYRMTVGPDGVLITGKDAAGVFYATQSLIQLAPPAGDARWAMPDGAAVSSVRIDDEPTFGWRGIQLDVGRWFLPVEDIKKLLDWMAFHKLNVFHWHLTEDQGWRFESKKYPKLTEIGAWRDSSPPYGNRNAADGKKHGGFYTQQQCRDVVAYAAKRHITVVPEIEIPGHSSAAIASYPYLGNDDIPGYAPTVMTQWGVQSYVLSPKEETFKYIEDVLDEVCKVFPSKFIHIGGDEAPKTQWKKSPYAQGVMKREGLKDEEELQSYIIKRVEGMLTKRGRRLIGWDEIREGGLSPNATVQAWRGEQGGIDTAREGKDVVMSPTSHMYFDYYQADPKSELAKGPEFECIGGFLPLEQVYSYYPLPTVLNAQEQKKILGLEGQIWGEYVKSYEKAMYLGFPRAAAMAETGWSPKSRKNYADFTERLAKVNEHYKAAGLKVGPLK